MPTGAAGFSPGGLAAAPDVDTPDSAEYRDYLQRYQTRKQNGAAFRNFLRGSLAEDPSLAAP